MNVEEIASWVLYNSDHYVVGCVGDVPRRSGTFANGQYIPLIKVNDTLREVCGGKCSSGL